jgi:hypothetical protein
VRFDWSDTRVSPAPGHKLDASSGVVDLGAQRKFVSKQAVRAGSLSKPGAACEEFVSRIARGS